MNIFAVPDLSGVFADGYWMWLLPLALVAMDVVTGTIDGLQKHKLKSSIAATGLQKKSGYFFLLLTVSVLNWAFELPFHFITFFSMYISLIELISILENLRDMGIRIPRFLTSALEDAVEDLEDGNKPGGSNGNNS